MLFSIISLLWAGMILGISCLEAWVKFKAPTLTKAVDLDIGRTVFRAFHRVQWSLLALLIVITFLCAYSMIYLLVLGGIIILLGIQTFWLMPRLCQAVDAFVHKNNVSNKYYHLLYSIAEIVKLFLLFAGGIYALVHIGCT